MTDRPRYAIYFAPSFESPWWSAGSRWLGRCAARGLALAQPPVPELDAAEQYRLTEAPRRYGWHATLKAPFSLARGVELATLRARLHDICREQRPFTMPPLHVALLGDFLALIPDPDSADPDSDDIDAIARACVIGANDLAEPLSSAELLRRRSDGLTPEQDALMVRWGYPYVMQCFRFHLSLTGLLRDARPATVRALKEAAARWFAPLPPSRFESVALFEESRTGADFMLLEHFELGARNRIAKPGEGAKL